MEPSFDEFMKGQMQGLAHQAAADEFQSLAFTFGQMRLALIVAGFSQDAAEGMVASLFMNAVENRGRA